MPIALRPARPDDLDALVRLLGQLFALEQDFTPDEPRQRRGLALLLERPASAAVLVAEQSGRVVGMVTAQLVVSTSEGALSALVEDMVVDAPARGGGAGRLLLQGIEAWAARVGATRLQLLADRDNAPALDFYARLGWSPTKLVALRRGGVPAHLAPSPPRET
ncbi:MAG TPA: GNAT family N-acetyltransferase [Anaeromyxobacteraceae bacterium]|nr:GNAT family N-acetyltransferase [Anaeromyxobacteraceae bacterium]